MTEAAGIGQVIKAVNSACKERGGEYAEYKCEIVSWDDAQRGTVGGAVSQWGANITDSMLIARDGTMLFTVRPNNWNEKIAKVSASQIALLTGNHMPNELAEYGNISLENFLRNAGTYGWYAGLAGSQNLYSEHLDHTIGIRFQTTFLPVENKAKANIQFCAESHNYNTRSDHKPKNLILLCTTQGTGIQQDGAGVTKLFHHRVANDGSVHRHWFEAERSGHAVGGEQVETEEEKRDALARGKAIARMIGIEAMKTRFNVLMTVQVPLGTAPERRPSSVPRWQPQPDDDGFWSKLRSFWPVRRRIRYSRQYASSGPVNGRYEKERAYSAARKLVRFIRTFHTRMRTRINTYAYGSTYVYFKVRIYAYDLIM